jgi:SMC interacting uncharacterized protein involved in chromosome segregation
MNTDLAWKILRHADADEEQGNQELKKELRKKLTIIWNNVEYQLLTLHRITFRIKDFSRLPKNLQRRIERYRESLVDLNKAIILESLKLSSLEPEKAKNDIENLSIQANELCTELIDIELEIYQPDSPYFEPAPVPEQRKRK